jgi:hypothetical protein
VEGRTNTPANIEAVREYVWTHPERDLLEAAGWLAGRLVDTFGYDLSPVGGDAYLAALVIYNAGHYPDPVTEAWWWTRWAGNLANYRSALERARAVV